MRINRRRFPAGTPQELAVFLLLFLVLATIYAWAIPYFLSIDETAHFEFVKRLTLDSRLPVITQSEYYAAEQHQPPAYYFLASLVGRALIASPLHGVAGDMALIFYGARAVSVLFGMATVAGMYLLAGHFFSNRPLERLGATAIVAFNPSLIAMAGAVTNDSMTSAAGVFLLLATVKAAASRLSIKALAAIGLLAGIAALTKQNLLPLLLPLGISLVLTARRAGSPHDMAKSVLAVTLPAAAVAGWWYLRNWSLYGDPLAWNVNALLSPGNVRHELPDLGSYFSVLISLAQTFWVGFGRVLDLRAPWPVYFAIWACCAAAIFGGLRLLRSRPDSSWLSTGRNLGLALIAFDLLLLFLADLSYHKSFVGAGAGRYLFPVAGGIAVLLTFGFRGAVRRGRPWLLGGFCALLLAISISSPFLYLFPLKATPVTVSETELRSEASPAHATFDISMQLVGYRIDSPRITPGDKVRLSLYWRAIEDTWLHWTGYVHIVDSLNEIYGQYDSIPLSDRYPTLFWRKGETWREDYEIPVRPDAPNGSYQLVVGFYSLQTEQGAGVSAQGREWVGGLHLGQLRVAAPEATPIPENRLAADFENSIRLAGWDQDPGSVTLYWQTETPVAKDLTVFAHLLNQHSQVVAQDDSRPAMGRMPTPVWEPGETVKDEHPVTAPPGTYTLEVGLYDPATMERVPLEAGKDSVLLGPVHVP